MSANEKTAVPASRQTDDASICPLCYSPGRHAFTGRDLLFDLDERYEYHECSNCGAVYQVPMPDARTIAGFYPDEYAPYDPDVRIKAPGNLHRAVLRERYGYRHLKPSRLARGIALLAGRFMYRDSIFYTPNGRMLDVGCGNGRYLRKMAALGWQCEGVEFNATAVDVCRRAGLRVHEGDLLGAHLSEAQFDLITARHVVEHIADPGVFMAEIARILKPGGRCLIRTPNSLALGRRWFGTEWFANDVPRHLILYSPENLTTLAERNGLCLDRLATHTSPKIILNSLDYKTHNRGKPSRKRKLRRLVARFYVVAATVTRRGDEIVAVYRKPWE